MHLYIFVSFYDSDLESSDDTTIDWLIAMGAMMWFIPHLGVISKDFCASGSIPNGEWISFGP